MKVELLEQQKFEKLESICSRDGFIHVFSYLCRRDCTFGYQEGLQGGDLNHFYSKERLIRTELSLLHGLIKKAGFNSKELTDLEIKEWAIETENLLIEMHEVFSSSFGRMFSQENTKLDMESFFSQEEIIRESVFYAAEQAFDFQFAELAKLRYQSDANWLSQNVGFDMDEGIHIYQAIIAQLNSNIQELVDIDGSEICYKSYLNSNALSVENISKQTKYASEKVESFLSAFTADRSEDNSALQAIDDVNVVNFKPIAKFDDKYFLFQPTALAQSMYESPIFWMRSDKNYVNKAVMHRGEFTESFAYQKLLGVFGEGSVFRNLDIFRNSSEKVGEVDILAKFGTKFLVIQAKSKGMTIPARKGKVNLVKDDFAKGVQNAYDQAVECAEALLMDGMVIKDADGNEVDLGCKPTTCYPVCLTSESYPNLSFQCRQYLKYEQSEFLKSPFVMDVFFLDILTEFLNQPLFLLSYIDRRSALFERIFGSTEIVLLSMHLKRNLWLDKEFTMMHLDDDIASDLDAAFMVRRMGLYGPRTPEGILERYSKGFISKLLFKLQYVKRDELTDFAFALMKASGKFLDILDIGVSRISFETHQDTRSHDFTVMFEGEEGGLTIHTKSGSVEAVRDSLLSYMHLRMYRERQNKWLGVIIEPKSQMVLELVHLKKEWAFDERLEEESKMLQPSTKPNLTSLKKKLDFKVGRNHKCQCGSGKKFKHCCIN
ncbi:SecA-like protein [Enterovibrio norvegicus FF-162]|uniref:hypothetical protein n=1 Tax=Enterovibrio norvegicus TaxID=188144 RepID=UPI0002FF015C|nr:hypothetical protein [Enterovibrio norvegicus]OEE85937.1 SecA-like protein [Enterovibrio norvegicus FF-162]